MKNIASIIGLYAICFSAHAVVVQGQPTPINSAKPVLSTAAPAKPAVVVPEINSALKNGLSETHIANILNFLDAKKAEAEAMIPAKQAIVVSTVKAAKQLIDKYRAAAKPAIDDVHKLIRMINVLTNDSIKETESAFSAAP